VVLTLVVLSFCLVTEAKAAKAKPIALQGTVYATDPSGQTVTLQAGDGTLTVLNVVRNTKLRRNNKKVALTGLVLGDHATALYDASNAAKQVSATGVVVSTLQGGVTGVDSGTGIVQLHTGQFNTNAHTRVVRNGEISTLGTLTVQDHVVAHVSHSQTAHSSSDGQSQGSDDTAVDVQVEGPEECEVEGTIIAIDLEANTVTISSEYDGGETTVNVTADTLIEVDDVVAPTIANLAVDQFVKIVYDSETSNAFRIEVENEDELGYADGPITAIDPVAGTITFDCYGAPVTLFVTANTKIEKNDEPAVFADLVVGDTGMAEYNTATMIAKEVEVESPDVED